LILVESMAFALPRLFRFSPTISLFFEPGVETYPFPMAAHHHDLTASDVCASLPRPAALATFWSSPLVLVLLVLNFPPLPSPSRQAIPFFFRDPPSLLRPSPLFSRDIIESCYFSPHEHASLPYSLAVFQDFCTFSFKVPSLDFLCPPFS